MTIIQYKTTKKINPKMAIDAGFNIDTEAILKAIYYVEEIISSIPNIVFQTIDFKAKSGLIGALFCKGVEINTDGMVNPIEKGYPDIIPKSGSNALSEDLMNYSHGIEVKCTAGSVAKGSSLKNGDQRIDNITSITWQAHHRSVNKVITLVWDFYNRDTSSGVPFKPIITGVFYTDQLTQDDWGSISGTTGRNTKVSGMKVSGKKKVGAGWIAILDEPKYIEKYKKILSIGSIP